MFSVMMDTANKTRKVALIAKFLNIVDESSSSSGSSSDTDEDDFIVLYNVLMLENDRNEYEFIPKITDFVERVIPGYSAYSFKEHFRMFPDTFQFVLRIISPGLTAVDYQSGRQSIDPHKQLLLALWFMSTPDSYRSVSTRFGVGKATAFGTVRRITYALHCIAKRFIKWPTTANEVDRVVQNFQAVKSFPGAIGAVDGCHIKIRAPCVDPASYYNRKKIHSIVLQAVCYGRSMFTHCYAGPAGSVHDARVFRNSPIARYLTSPDQFFPNNTHLTGDAAYPLSTHVMVPFKDNGHLTQRQKNYNYRLSATRMAIERAFGLLKTRFRILLDCLPLTDLRKIPEFVIACCVLHNICVAQSDLSEFDVGDVAEEEAVAGAMNAEDGADKRIRIMNELPFMPQGI